MILDLTIRYNGRKIVLICVIPLFNMMFFFSFPNTLNRRQTNVDLR